MNRGAEVEISVVVLNWNRKNLLRACLASLARQSVAPFELIVVDNGSTDGSAAMVRDEFASGMPFHLTLIENWENRGYCAGNNQGLASAKGRLVALLNNDAEAEPGWLAALRSAFQEDSGVGMAASKILAYENSKRIDKAGHLIYADGQNRGRGTGEIDHGQYDRREEVLWPDGCAAMYRREMLERIGGFDEDFFAYGDDAELGLRARIAGWRCLYVPDAVVRHHRASSLGAGSTRRVELIERNRVLLAAKLFPWSLLWLNSLFYLVRIAAGAAAAVRGQGELANFPGWRGKLRLIWALLRADLEALRLLPKMLRKRRQIRQIRKLTPGQVRRLILRHRISPQALTG
jgi:GT2 family glycosyltransferase